MQNNNNDKNNNLIIYEDQNSNNNDNLFNQNPNQNPNQNQYQHQYQNQYQQQNQYQNQGQYQQQNQSSYDRIEFSSNIHIKQTLRPNFSKHELNSVEIPIQIAREIRSEKFRILWLIFFGTIAMGLSLFFIILYWGVSPNEQGYKLGISPNWQAHPALMIILMITGFLIFTIGIVDFSHISMASKKYRGDILMGIEQIPYFLIKNYRALISRPIYTNWIAFNIYVWGGIIIGIFYAIQGLSDQTMWIEIVIMISILFATFFIHIFSLILTRARKGNINAYYGYEILSFEEIRDIRKRANRTCLIIFYIFILLVFSVFIILYIIFRKNKGKKIIPFL